MGDFLLHPYSYYIEQNGERNGKVGKDGRNEENEERRRWKMKKRRLEISTIIRWVTTATMKTCNMMVIYSYAGNVGRSRRIFSLVFL